MARTVVHAAQGCLYSLRKGVVLCSTLTRWWACAHRTECSLPPLPPSTRGSTHLSSLTIATAIQGPSRTPSLLFSNRYSDRTVQHLQRHVTYEIVEITREELRSMDKYMYGSLQENIGIPIRFTASSRPYMFTPVELVGQFLEHIKKKVEDDLNCEVTNIAIAVPNTFGQRARQVRDSLFLFSFSFSFSFSFRGCECGSVRAARGFARVGNRALIWE